METNIPKQFLLLSGKPIIIQSIEKFISFDPEIEVIIVLPQSQIDFWKKLCIDFNFKYEHIIIEGGKERFCSAKNGVKMSTGDIIAVHDAVRPMVSVEVIKRCFESAEKNGAAIPVIPINDSIRRVIEEGSVPRNRDDFRIVQTPQCFQRKILVDAYNVDYKSSFTDDASVVEEAGYEITLIEGNQENIKITRTIDLKIAEKLSE